jgi:hypothetical protein
MVATPHPCPHCNGTTFCGGFFRGGMLMTEAACASCAVKSGLPDRGSYHKVVCSVCGGTGVRPKGSSGSSKYSQGFVMLLVSPLLLAAGALLCLSVLGLVKWLNQDEEVRAGLRQAVQRRHLEISGEELKAFVPVGSTRDEARRMLGEPDTSREMESGQDAVELWYYQCNDGRVQITFFNGKVQGVKQ